MHVEHELERLLRRERPPAGFAARVMEQVKADDARRGRSASTTHTAWWRAVAAAVLLTLVGGSWMAHHEIERRRGEQAKAQVLLALRITSSKMHHAREHVRDLESQSIEVFGTH